MTKVKKRKLVRHGTRHGYSKHQRYREGAWPWPACERCQQAHREYVNRLREKPEVKQLARWRANARQKAFRRLQAMHPGDFAKLYSEELSILRDGGTVVISNLLAQLQAIAGQGAEERLRKLVAGNCATLEERRAHYEIQSLRERIAEIQADVDARAAVSGS